MPDSVRLDSSLCIPRKTEDFHAILHRENVKLFLRRPLTKWICPPILPAASVLPNAQLTEFRWLVYGDAKAIIDPWQTRRGSACYFTLIVYTYSKFSTIRKRVTDMSMQAFRICGTHWDREWYEAYRDQLQEFHGELRYAARQTGNYFSALIPHCLSARYPIKQANDRCQNLLSRWAEPMAAYALQHGTALAPGFLAMAWKWLRRNQPHDSICGCSVDATHADMPFRFHQAEEIADGLRRQAMAELSAPTHEFAKTDGTLTVWNPLPYARCQVCEIEVVFAADYAAKALRSGHTGPLQNQFELVTAAGDVVPHQVMSTRKGCTVKRPNEQGRRMVAATNAEVYRIAVPLELPAAGFCGLQVRPIEGVGALKRQINTMRTGPLQAENQYLELTVESNGTITLRDKQSAAVYRDLLQYEDSGDAGDGWSYVPPLANNIIVGAGDCVSCALEHDGPLQVSFRIERRLRVPAALGRRTIKNSAVRNGLNWQ